MKKLVGILSMLTITGSGMSGIVGNAPVLTKNEINYLQTNNLKKLNRSKREVNDDKDEIEASGTYKDMLLYASFRPDLFNKEIQSYHDTNLWDYNNYKKLFKNRISKDVLVDQGIFFHLGLGEHDAIDLFIKGIWNNWDMIVSDWTNNGGQIHRIRIVMKVNRNNGNINFISSNVRTDENEYKNKYIKNLESKIKLLNINMEEKCIIYFDVQSKKIKFLFLGNGNDTFLTNKNIIFRDQNEKVIRIVTFNENDLIINVLKSHNLFDYRDGLGYKNGYSIEVESSKANTTQFIKNNYKSWVWNNFDKKWREKFIIIDDNIIDFNLHKKEYFNNLLINIINIKKNDKFKAIKDIDINSLNFGNAEVTSNSDSLKSIDEKSVCFKPLNFPNTSSSSTQKIKVPSCSYETKTKYLFQITTGLNINNSKNIAKRWNLNIDDEMILTDFTNSSKKVSEIKNTLSKDFDLSNTNKQEQELILNRDLLHSPEQELSVEPKQRLTAQYAIRSLSIKTNLDLKQKISGTIIAKIIDDNNEEQIITLSIKETMQILQKYNLLPNEITINEDNSVTFNGKAIISRTSESDPRQIFNFRPI